jgi:hypothetical protein
VLVDRGAVQRESESGLRNKDVNAQHDAPERCGGAREREPGVSVRGERAPAEKRRDDRGRCQQDARPSAQLCEHLLLLPERPQTERVREFLKGVHAAIVRDHLFIVASSSDVRAGVRRSRARLRTQRQLRRR